MSLPVIGILILNRDGERWLGPLYDSLRENGNAGIRIFLVDNASSDGSVPMTLERYPEVTVVAMPENLGYSMAYNLATPHAIAAGCEWLIWSNNDVLLEKGCLNELLAAARSDDRIRVVGPAFLDWKGDGPNYYMQGNHPRAIAAMRAGSPVPIDVEWVEGSFLMLHRRCFDQLGGLDPWYCTFWEEADFCRRVRHAGFRVVLAPRALARHYGGGTTPQSRGHRDWLLARNQFIYKLTHPGRSFARNLGAALHVLLVEVREGLASNPAAAGMQMRAFTCVLAELRRAHRKWKDDRKLRHPDPTTSDLASAKAEVLQQRVSNFPGCANHPGKIP